MKIEDFNRKVEYWNAFWQKEVIDRPLICVTAPKSGVEYHPHIQTDNISAMACMNEDYDSFFESVKRNVRSTYYGGEAIPYVNLTLGPDQYAGYLGAKITMGEGMDTTWVHSIVNDWDEFDVKIHKEDESYFNKMKKFLSYAAKAADGEFAAGMLDLHSNMDALSALRGPQDLCFDLYDYPEKVHRILNDVRKTYSEVFEMAYNAGNMKETGSIGWAPTYAPKGKFAVIQCDFSCLISPDQVREFVIPAIEEEAAFLDYNVYHYDGKDALGHLDDILAIKDIDVIQWVPGDGQPRSIEWMDLLKKIQRAGKGLWIYDWTCEEILEHFKELRPEGLVFSVGASSEDEAKKLLENVARKM